ncbi:unnamed protein product [Toxocara canis]|uniref:SHSP domain-containing protein n=1 Tax=Toxocara canis TaxID=6265 RepID=A0A183U3J1_TOXCA|nr:unnamed protein product [Toxocara canis]
MVVLGKVSVTTNAKDNTLAIEAKHKDENSKYEFSRKMTLPAGVVPKELTCRFKTDGVLEVKAPYNPPPEAEPIKDTDIQLDWASVVGLGTGQPSSIRNSQSIQSLDVCDDTNATSNLFIQNK